jgi:hypothetical protein
VEDGQIVAIGTGNISTIFQTINGNIYAAGMYKVDETRICDVTQDYWLTGIEPDPSACSCFDGAEGSTHRCRRKFQRCSMPMAQLWSQLLYFCLFARELLVVFFC